MHAGWTYLETDEWNGLMATETFTWRANSGVNGPIKFRVLSAQMGDGYEQTASDGINAKSGSWPLTFTGNKALISQIKAFLDRHAGWKAFYWREPFGELILVKTPDGYAPKDVGADVYTLTVTFKQ